ncbi:hypothetical protein [Streptomyces sp. NPDC001404]|uniref:hypothetical protein n=1 Tax=Streptomyces sp. NPDC001404 TaxID=3364571 RepID=UPI003680ED31
MKAIDRNDTDLVTKIRDRFTHVTYKGVENQYRGNECEADAAWTTLRMHAKANLFEMNEGKFYRIDTVGGLNWYELRAPDNVEDLRPVRNWTVVGVRWDGSTTDNPAMAVFSGAIEAAMWGSDDVLSGYVRVVQARDEVEAARIAQTQETGDRESDAGT